MVLANYSPEDVVFLLGGVIPLSGFADGTFISIRKANPIFETVVSADGKVSRTQVENPLYTVTLTLSSVASDNEILTAISFADKKTGRGKLPIMVKDNLGTSIFYASLAWIESTPDMSFGTDVSTRDWVFSCIGVTEVVGGNDSVNTIPGPLAALGFEALDNLVG
jgi:hypothetical protein